MSQNTAVVPFRFESNDVRTIKDESGNPWFVAKDVCNVLGFSNHNDAIAKSQLDDDERGVAKIYPSHIPKGVDVVTISESGLYTLIIRSNKPEARKFRKWITSEVLPAIRKDGFYGVNEKRCSKCNRILPFDMFQKDSRTKTGLHYYCTECRANGQRERLESKRSQHKTTLDYDINDDFIEKMAKIFVRAVAICSKDERI